MNRIALLLPLLLIAACNWSDLEAELLAAAPEGRDLTLAPPTEESQSQELSSDLGTREDALARSKIFFGVLGTARNVNGLVDALCGALDAIRDSRIPPTRRDENALTWGPFDDEKHPGLQVQVVLRRGEEGSLYELQWGRAEEPDSLVKVIVGEFYGERAREGYGRFVLDAALARQIGVADPSSPDDLGQIERVVLDYDMRSGISQATMRFETTDASADISYEVEPQGGGWMSYRWSADFVPSATSQRELLLVDARWRDDKAGWATATIRGGDLPPTVEGAYAECWDASRMQVYWERNYDCGLGERSCGEGTRDQCPLSPPASL